MAVESKRYYAGETDSDQLDRYRLLVESIEDYAIFLLDTEGHIVSWNLGAEKFKGYKPQEIIGKHFSVFYTKKDNIAGKPAWELEESMKNGRVEDEGWRVRKDGTRFWANVIITALYDEQGRHRGFAKVTRDLTERKRYEDRLEKTNAKLEASYSELQKLNNAKDEFVVLASHQLRTPATGVKQYLSLLLEGYVGPLTEQQEDCIKKAYESNDRQIDIVNDLLHVAQLDAGRIILEKSQTDLQEMIENIIDEQVDVFKKRKQRIRLNFSEDLSSVELDEVRFRMVLENLVDNASKYTPDGGEITISAQQEGTATKIAVADTGVGIPKKEHGKIFDKFTRVSTPLGPKVAGSGLGLYWVKNITQLHGGRIDVNSTPNKGTVFTISVPTRE